MIRLLLACAMLTVAAGAYAQTTTTPASTAPTGATVKPITTPKKPKSPGEMAAEDRIKAEKRNACIKNSREQTPKLGFIARRKFVSACIKK